MSAGQEFWIIASSLDDAATKMKSVDSQSFPIGDLQAGSFDTLVHLTDDLAKADSMVDSIVHRLERQYAEVEPEGKYTVKSASGEHKLADYLNKWQWDEAKYPKSRAVAENLKFLSSTVAKMDEEARAKIQQFNDSKTQRQNIGKKDAATLTTRDLVDVLTPSVVGKDDFVYSEHLTTVCVILARGASIDFLKKYEDFTEHVVPGTAKHFKGMDDKDGNELWRVVLLKSELDQFKKACREMRVAPRDFEYSSDGYTKLIKQREQIDIQCADQLAKVKSICQISWSDALIAWIHIKAMRVHVECILRYGQGSKFSAYVMAPKAAPSARKSLDYVFGGDEEDKAMTDAAAEDGEEYFPYVSLSFTPMTATLK